METALDLIVKYGIPILISGIAIWVVVDLYSIAKKKWVPDFLESFKNIAEHVKGLDESVHVLAAKSAKIDAIEIKVTAIHNKLMLA